MKPFILEIISEIIGFILESDLNFLTIPDISNRHLIHSKGAGLIWADGIGSTHDLTTG